MTDTKHKILLQQRGEKWACWCTCHPGLTGIGVTKRAARLALEMLIERRVIPRPPGSTAGGA